MILDLILAAAVLVLISPVFILVAVAVKLDGGPLFYGHTRLGKGGREFSCLKFRSMVVDSAGALERHLALSADARLEWEETHKLRNDPRVTRVGRIIRKLSLDELPQLFNVLRLEMSLVGPRPIVAAEVPRYGDAISYYYAARPGITGLWQVSGRTQTSYTDRVRLDELYVRNWSHRTDMTILLRTIPAVLKGHGAY